MTLEIIMNNHILYDRMIRHLDIRSRIHLSMVSRHVYCWMKEWGYINSIYFKNSTMEEYIKSLELLDEHKKYISTVVFDRVDDLFTYIPKGIENKYKLIIRNCSISISGKDHDKIIEFLKKTNIENTFLKYVDSKTRRYINKQLIYNI